jgi:hypothetical protein
MQSLGIMQRSPKLAVSVVDSPRCVSNAAAALRLLMAAEQKTVDDKGTSTLRSCMPPLSLFGADACLSAWPCFRSRGRGLIPTTSLTGGFGQVDYRCDWSHAAVSNRRDPQGSRS